MKREDIEAMLVDLERVRKLAKQTIGKENTGTYHAFDGTAKFTFIKTGKLTGSLRRASMDLTRTLAEMRKR